MAGSTFIRMKHCHGWGLCNNLLPKRGHAWCRQCVGLLLKSDVIGRNLVIIVLLRYT
jgi:hypothetical protein